MTVCIAALCERQSGVVLIADRMITTGLEIQFEHRLTRKITKLSENCLALTAGNALAYTELFDAVARATSNLRVTAAENFVEVIKESYQALRQKQIEERVLRPLAVNSFEDFYHIASRLPEPVLFNVWQTISAYDYGLEILVGGITGQRAHIHVVKDPGTSECYDSIGFHVIGSGTNLALSSLMGSNCHAGLPVAEVVMLTMNAKMTAENAPGVGRLTDVSIVLPRRVVDFDNQEVRQLKEYCRMWQHGDTTCLGEITAIINAKLSVEETAVPPEDEPNTIQEETDNEPEADPNAEEEGVVDRDPGGDEAPHRDEPSEE